MDINLYDSFSFFFVQKRNVFLFSKKNLPEKGRDQRSLVINHLGKYAVHFQRYKSFANQQVNNKIFVDMSPTAWERVRQCRPRYQRFSFFFFL